MSPVPISLGSAPPLLSTHLGLLLLGIECSMRLSGHVCEALSLPCESAAQWERASPHVWEVHLDRCTHTRAHTHAVVSQVLPVPSCPLFCSLLSFHHVLPVFVNIFFLSPGLPSSQTLGFQSFLPPASPGLCLVTWWFPGQMLISLCLLYGWSFPILVVIPELSPPKVCYCYIVRHKLSHNCHICAAKADLHYMPRP